MTFVSLKRILLIVAIAAVVGGVATALLSASQPTSYGWFAYAPLSGETFSPNIAFAMSPQTAVALVVAVFGLVAAAFWAGLTVAERRSRSAHNE
ncbi:hypothetical protein ITJ38_01230 [Agreia pratensis]|uniref:hypothetical protein n=1 Tax=Agreia pratensis TaxID=150121 RepID=UPI00188A0EF9|nr:hypothetical protein [Agreia pratensis]MBF4633020.1 hypothetical protein [Agreia pratensis]